MNKYKQGAMMIEHAKKYSQNKANRKKAKPIHHENMTTPFDSAEDAWFWFLDAYQAKHDGARIASGLALVPRPCEPLDILHSVDKLYRNRRLVWDHLLVLKHYGERKMPPDRNRSKEVRAYYLWQEAIKRLEEVLVRKKNCQTTPTDNQSQIPSTKHKVSIA